MHPSQIICAIFGAAISFAGMMIADSEQSKLAEVMGVSLLVFGFTMIACAIVHERTAP